MKAYIDKSALVAEIKRRRDYYKRNPLLVNAKYCIDEDNAILKLLDTLEVKEVDFDDFGFYWGEYVSNLGGDINNYEVAKYFYELGLKAQKGE